MPGLKYINRLSKINRLIKLKSTGTTKDLSKKLDICERQVYKYISDLRELGAEIKFNQYTQTYEYVNDKDFHLI